jgi:uncharacterized membrane protein
MENRTKAPRGTPRPMEDDALNDALMETFPASDPLTMVNTLIPGSKDETSKTAPHDQESRHTNPRGGREAAADLLDEPDLADSLPMVVFLMILLGVLLMLDAWPSYFV